MLIDTHPALVGVIDNSSTDTEQSSIDSVALIADDDNSSREILSMRLSRFFGYKVHAYDTVRDAERFVRRGQDPLHIAFVDFSFPGEDGTDVIHALRECLPIVPIVSVSAYDIVDYFSDGLLNPDIAIGKMTNRDDLKSVLGIGEEIYLARRRYLDDISERVEGPLPEGQVHLRRMGVLSAGRSIIRKIGAERTNYDKAA